MNHINFIKNILKLKLSKRVIFLTQRIYCLCFNRLYIWLVVLPYLMFREKLNKSFTIKYAFNSVVVIDKKRIFKVLLNSKSTIDLEYKNFKKTLNLYPSLSNVLPNYKIREKVFIKYLSTDRYEEVDLQRSIDPAIQIFNLIRDCHKSGMRLSALDSIELITGLKIISNIYGDVVIQKIQLIIDDYLMNGKYHIGFAHGDFPSRNILIDEDLKPKIIDLDCVRFFGLQELDVLYYLIEYEWSKTGAMWYETIARYLDNNISTAEITILKYFGVDYDHGLAVTYLVDRIGQESENYGFKYSDTHLASAINGVLSVPFNIKPTLSKV